TTAPSSGCESGTGPQGPGGCAIPCDDSTPITPPDTQPLDLKGPAVAPTLATVKSYHDTNLLGPPVPPPALPHALFPPPAPGPPRPGQRPPQHRRTMRPQTTGHAGMFREQAPAARAVGPCRQGPGILGQEEGGLDFILRVDPPGHACRWREGQLLLEHLLDE